MIPSALLSSSSESLSLFRKALEESHGRIPTRTKLRQILGDGLNEVYLWLENYKKTHGSVICVTEVISAIIQTRNASKRPEELFDLILSGPEVSEVPTCDTLTTIHNIIHEAEKEILICDYAIYGAKSVFEHLNEALIENPNLQIRLVLHVFDNNKLSSPKNRIVEFKETFIKKYWAGDTIPQLYVDPRNLKAQASEHASMHAKCFVCDRKSALITSANLTDAAHCKNIEAGIVVRYTPLVERLVNYFDGLIENEVLVEA